MYGYGNSMFLATHGILARTASGGGVDPDAQAFITAASITDPTQQSAINTLVTDLKGYNIWTKMKALYPMVGGTATTHKFNLKDPRDLDAAFRLVFSGGWTHSANGALPNGTNAYADTKFNAFLLSQSLTSSHLTYYQRGVSDSGTSRTKIGAATNDTVADGFAIGFFSAGTREVGVVGSVGSAEYAPSGASAEAQGLFMINTNGNRNARHWKNGVANGAAVTQTGAMPNFNIYLAALNSSSPTPYYHNKQCAFASIGDGLTDTEAANFYTAVQAFQVTLGRSIGTQSVSDADAQAFVTNAGIVDQVEANAVNNLVIGLKADGLWTKMKAVYPMVGGTNSQHSWNLRNTAQFQISWIGGVTSSANGVQFNGTNSYGNTGLVASTSLALNSTHISVYSRTNSDILAPSISNYVGANNFETSLWLRTGNLSYLRINTPTASTQSTTDSRGTFIGNRNSSTQQQLMVRGTRYDYSVNSNTLNNLLNYQIGGSVTGGPVFWDNKQLAFASIGDGLTNTEMTNLTTRIDNFQLALNRNV